MGDLGNHDLDLPFEPDDSGGHLLDQHRHVAGGLVVMAATVDLEDVGKQPALVFRFSAPTGDFYPPFVLVTDDDQMAKLRPLIQEAIATARRAAKAGGS